MLIVECTETTAAGQFVHTVLQTLDGLVHIHLGGAPAFASANAFGRGHTGGLYAFPSVGAVTEVGVHQQVGDIRTCKETHADSILPHLFYACSLFLDLVGVEHAVFSIHDVYIRTVGHILVGLHVVVDVAVQQVTLLTLQVGVLLQVDAYFLHLVDVGLIGCCRACEIAVCLFKGFLVDGQEVLEAGEALQRAHCLFEGGCGVTVCHLLLDFCFNAGGITGDELLVAGLVLHATIVAVAGLVYHAMGGIQHGSLVLIDGLIPYGAGERLAVEQPCELAGGHCRCVNHGALGAYGGVAVVQSRAVGTQEHGGLVVGTFHAGYGPAGLDGGLVTHPSADGSTLVGTLHGTRDTTVGDEEGGFGFHAASDDTAGVLCTADNGTVVDKVGHGDGAFAGMGSANHAHEGLTLDYTVGGQGEVLERTAGQYLAEQTHIVRFGKADVEAADGVALAVEGAPIAVEWHESIDS